MSESTSFDRGANIKPGDFPPMPETKDELLIEALRLAERTSGLFNEIGNALGKLVGDDAKFDGLYDLLRRRFTDCSGTHLFIAANNIGLDLPADLLPDENTSMNEGIMSENKHTPLPWRAFHTPIGHTYIGVGDAGAEGILDGGFGLWRDGPERDANAEFIVTAVNAHDELLAALKWARTCVPMPSDCHDAIVAAIAKATGERP